MIDFRKYSFLSQVYTIEKTLEVVVRFSGEKIATAIRIEALRNERTGHYLTRGYRQENLTLQPTTPPVVSDFGRMAERHDIWLPYHLPRTDRSNPDECLEQALGFLQERCEK